MKVDDWKVLFQQKGWLIGGKIVDPAGHALEIMFSTANSGVAASQVSEVTDSFFMTTGDNQDYTDWHYYHWEDIASVRIVKWK